MEKQYDFFEKYFLLFSLLLLISLPFGYFFSSLIFVLWFAFCFFYGLKLKTFSLNKDLYPLIIFSLFSFVSLIWSQDSTETFHAISRQLPLLLFPIAAMFVPKISQKKVITLFHQYSKFLILFALVMVFLAVLRYNKYQYKNFLYYHELVFPLKLNAIYVSYIFSVFFLFNLTLLKIKINQTKSFLVLIILGIFLVLLSSKMVLATTVLLSLVILWNKIKGKTQKLVVLGLIIPFFVLVFKYVKPVQNRFATEFNTSFFEIFNAKSFEKGRVYTGLEARLLQIRVFKDIIDTPSEFFIGVGLSASKNEIKEINIKLNTPTIFQTHNFHNQYIQVFAELGLIGFVLLIMILVVGFRKSLKIKFLLPFIIVTTALFFSESVIWRQRGIMFFGIMYILLITISKNYESKKSISEI